MIQKERLVNTFLELTAVDNPSYQERTMCDALKKRFTSLGFSWQEDDAAQAVHGTCGNVYGFLKGNAPELTPVLLVSHMDAVSPAVHKKAIRHADGTITSDGTTVLAADDLAGMSEILEVLTSMQEDSARRPDIEILLPVAEEMCVIGSSHFDASAVHARQAYVLDLTGPIGRAVRKAPTIEFFTVTITGRSAHSGFEPEKGINALSTAVEAMHRLPAGRIEADTTFNFGIVTAGENTNLVPGKCVIKGEMRSYVHDKVLQLQKKMEQIFTEEAARTGARAEFEYSCGCRAYELAAEDPALIRYQNACRAVNITPLLDDTFGGSDAANLVRQGISAVCMASAMYDCHKTTEFTREDDMVRAAQLLESILHTR
jgi:tripeptide aminopeptidase